MSYGKRHSIYLRKEKDKDLISYIDELLPYHDFAEVSRSLMRDGIKYRSLSNSSRSHTEPTPNVLPTSTAPTPINPVKPDIKLSKIEVSEDELINRLDDF